MKLQNLQAKSKWLILPAVCPGQSSAFQEVLASMRSDNITLATRKSLHYLCSWHHDGRNSTNKISWHFAFYVKPCMCFNFIEWGRSRWKCQLSVPLSCATEQFQSHSLPRPSYYDFKLAFSIAVEIFRTAHFRDLKSISFSKLGTSWSEFVHRVFHC